MKLFRKLTFAMLGIAALMALPFSVLAATNLKASYLYVQRADSGVLTATKKANIYKLVLKKVDPFVIYFTDRPERKAGLMPTQLFYKEWNENKLHTFKQEAPNVGLIGVNLHTFLDGKDNSTVWTLSNPKYYPAKAEVTYTAQVVNNGNVLPKKIKLKYVALFFDPFCPTCS